MAQDSFFGSFRNSLATFTNKVFGKHSIDKERPYPGGKNHQSGTVSKEIGNEETQTTCMNDVFLEQRAITPSQFSQATKRKDFYNEKSKKRSNKTPKSKESSCLKKQQTKPSDNIRNRNGVTSHSNMLLNNCFDFGKESVKTESSKSSLPFDNNDGRVCRNENKVPKVETMNKNSESIALSSKQMTSKDKILEVVNPVKPTSHVPPINNTVVQFKGRQPTHDTSKIPKSPIIKQGNQEFAKMVNGYKPSTERQGNGSTKQKPVIEEHRDSSESKKNHFTKKANTTTDNSHERKTGGFNFSLNLPNHAVQHEHIEGMRHTTDERYTCGECKGTSFTNTESLFCKESSKKTFTTSQCSRDKDIVNVHPLLITDKEKKKILKIIQAYNTDTKRANIVQDKSSKTKTPHKTTKWSNRPCNSKEIDNAERKPKAEKQSLLNLSGKDKNNLATGKSHSVDNHSNVSPILTGEVPNTQKCNQNTQMHTLPISTKTKKVKDEAIQNKCLIVMNADNKEIHEGQNTQEAFLTIECLKDPKMKICASSGHLLLFCLDIELHLCSAHGILSNKVRDIKFRKLSVENQFQKYSLIVPKSPTVHDMKLFHLDRMFKVDNRDGRLVRLLNNLYCKLQSESDVRPFVPTDLFTIQTILGVRYGLKIPALVNLLYSLKIKTKAEKKPEQELKIGVPSLCSLLEKCNLASQEVGLCLKDFACYMLPVVPCVIKQRKEAPAFKLVGKTIDIRKFQGGAELLFSDIGKPRDDPEINIETVKENSVTKAPSVTLIDNDSQDKTVSNGPNEEIDTACVNQTCTARCENNNTKETNRKNSGSLLCNTDGNSEGVQRENNDSVKTLRKVPNMPKETNKTVFKPACDGDACNPVKETYSNQRLGGSKNSNKSTSTGDSDDWISGPVIDFSLNWQPLCKRSRPYKEVSSPKVTKRAPPPVSLMELCRPKDNLKQNQADQQPEENYRKGKRMGKDGKKLQKVKALTGEETERKEEKDNCYRKANKSFRFNRRK